MLLFQEKLGELVPLEKDPFKLEREIQVLVERNIETIFSLELVKSEFSVGDFRLDSLAFDSQSNSFVIIEYKKGSSYSVIDQGYSYLSVMLNNKAEFILEYNEQNQKTLKRSDVDWSSSRVVFVSPSFNSYQKNSVNFKDVPFELWEIRRFESGLVALEKIESSSKESIQSTTSSTTNTVIQEVSTEVASYSLEDHFRNVNPEAQNLWEILKERLEDLSDTKIEPKKANISCKRNGSSFSYVSTRKKELRIEIHRGNIKLDGERSKGFFTLDDPKGLAQEKSWTWKDGVIGNLYVIPFSKPEQIDYLMYLINQKYESLE
ncbi:MAG: hypothetical protein HWE12_00145 [Oceanospirillaceae bacterium]|nr:hypothetical protein [Oceanospirillaceae bacterium]